MVKLEIATDNAAFGPDAVERNAEIAAILKRAAFKLETTMAHDEPTGFRLFDSNGNDVGRIRIL